MGDLFCAMFGVQEGIYPIYRIQSQVPVPHLQVVQRVSHVHVIDLGPLNPSYATVPSFPNPGYYKHQPGVYSCPVNYYPMQIPTGATMPLPAHYHSYFGTTPNNSRPIPIHRTPHDPFGSYDLSNRVMTFTPPTANVAPRDSYYAMDYMGYDLDQLIAPPAQPSASTSTAISSAPIAIRSNSSATAHLVDFPRDVAPIDNNKENGANDDSASVASISGIRMIGEPGMRGYKRRGSADELINEETESETGFSASGDEFDCRSHCGCVHNCDDEDEVEPAPSTQPIRRPAFRSIGDILGYAKVVRSERMETLAELQNALERFNTTRQQRRSSRQ